MNIIIEYNKRGMMASKKAWIISVDMGYGHQRAAYPLKDISYERIITANSDKIITPKEKKRWARARLFYEGISRFSSFPLIGRLFFEIYDVFQHIPRFYPFRDLSIPNYATLYVDVLIKNNLGKSVTDHVRKKKIPFVSTFFIPSIAAAYHGIKDVYCITTDTDINRAWVPKNPKTKIKYFASCDRVAKRLKEYGVPERNIFLTGFPLPKENLGGRNLKILKRDIGIRLINLDPNKHHISKYRDHIKRHIGRKNFKEKRTRPLTITFVVGGAGAQRNIAKMIVEGLRKKIRKKELAINLVAGTRLEIRDYFERIVINAGLKSHIGKEINIVFGINKKDYFEKFNDCLHSTDILWTKPSELVFYTALGLPIIMTKPLGAQEYYNKRWLDQMGGGFTQFNPMYVDEWLFDWIDKGILAEAAWEGFMGAPKLGIYEIEKILFQKTS